MDVISSINNRKSIRKYKKDPVLKDALEQILESARMAPSAGNRQPWHFIIITDPKIKQLLGISSWAANAPIILVGCVDTTIKPPPKCYIDGAIAFDHIILTATHFGLGSCWMGMLGDDQQIKKVLSIPEHIHVFAITPLGYPDETGKSKIRKPLSEIVHYNEF